MNPSTNHRQRRKAFVKAPERGAIMLLVLLATFPILIGIALVVDGFLAMTYRTQRNNNAEYGAMAGMRELRRRCETTPATNWDTIVLTDAQDGTRANNVQNQVINQNGYVTNTAKADVGRSTSIRDVTSKRVRTDDEIEDLCRAPWIANCVGVCKTTHDTSCRSSCPVGACQPPCDGAACRSGCYSNTSYPKCANPCPSAATCRSGCYSNTTYPKCKSPCPDAASCKTGCYSNATYPNCKSTCPSATTCRSHCSDCANGCQSTHDSCEGACGTTRTTCNNDCTSGYNYCVGICNTEFGTYCESQCSGAICVDNSYYNDYDEYWVYQYCIRYNGTTSHCSGSWSQCQDDLDEYYGGGAAGCVNRCRTGLANCISGTGWVDRYDYPDIYYEGCTTVLDRCTSTCNTNFNNCDSPCNTTLNSCKNACTSVDTCRTNCDTAENNCVNECATCKAACDTATTDCNTQCTNCGSACDTAATDCSTQCTNCNNACNTQSTQCSDACTALGNCQNACVGDCALDAGCVSQCQRDCSDDWEEAVAVAARYPLDCPNYVDINERVTDNFATCTNETSVSVQIGDSKNSGKGYKTFFPGLHGMREVNPSANVKAIFDPIRPNNDPYHFKKPGT